MFRALGRSSIIPNLENCLRFIRRPTRTAKKGLNLHLSKRAKEGLYHGKDVMFGHTIAHSGKKSKKKWNPNVIRKRVWSDALDDWVRFSMTTKALKEIDMIGGIDNYMLSLDEKSVSDSKTNTRVRNQIAVALFKKGELEPRLIKKLGYHKSPPIFEEQL